MHPQPKNVWDFLGKWAVIWRRARSAWGQSGHSDHSDPRLRLANAAIKAIQVPGSLIRGQSGHFDHSDPEPTRPAPPVYGSRMTISRPTISCLTVLIATAAALAACAPAKPTACTDSVQLTPARTTAVRDSVKALLAEFTERMNKSDMKGVANLYSTDSTFFWIEGASVRYQSVKDLRDALQTLKNVPQIELKFYETRIDVLSPTIADVRTEFSQSFMNGAGRGDTYGGYMTITVVREKNGWRMRNGHTSSRKPRP